MLRALPLLGELWVLSGATWPCQHPAASQTHFPPGQWDLTHPVSFSWSYLHSHMVRQSSPGDYVHGPWGNTEKENCFKVYHPHLGRNLWHTGRKVAEPIGLPLPSLPPSCPCFNMTFLSLATAGWALLESQLVLLPEAILVPLPRPSLIHGND